jgi:glycosyltransferase involved in cell wall biosynthesis
VAGDGPMRKELETLIDKYNLQKHIFLLGYQSNVGRLLNNCNVFVHPSYAEGFGIVIPEAMLAEKPIIVSNAGALPELIENEVSGLVVEPHDAGQWADAILRIIENPKLSEKLASNGKERANKEFSKEKFTLNYENLYKELLVK